MSYLPWHTNRNLVAISYLKKEKERGRKEEREEEKEGSSPSFAIKSIVEERLAFDGLTQTGYLLEGEKVCSFGSLRSVCMHLCWGTAVLWIIDRDPVLEKNRICTL